MLFRSTASTNITVSIPYSSPQSVLCTSFGGFGLQNGGDPGNLHSNTWGTLILYVDLPQNDSVSVSAYISFRDFEAYVPRQTPGVGPIPTSTSIVRVARPTPKPRMVRRQGGTLADLILTPESRCFIVAHTTAPYYSILLVNPDEEYAISMFPHGDESVLRYSSRDGTRLAPTAPAFILWIILIIPIKSTIHSIYFSLLNDLRLYLRHKRRQWVTGQSHSCIS